MIRLAILLILLLIPIDEDWTWHRKERPTPISVPTPAVTPTPVPTPQLADSEYVYGPKPAMTNPWLKPNEWDTGQCPLVGGYGWSGSLSYPMPAHTEIKGITTDRHFWATKGHRGVDFSAPPGTPVYASAPGVVVWAGKYTYGWGETVALAHGGGWITVYAHMGSVAVACGQGVGRGQLIGYSGQTGLATWPHLHLEVRYGDIFDPKSPVVYNPENYLP